MQILLIFPHQLFESNLQLTRLIGKAYLVEDPLFFVQYQFHKQKLVLHRASMQAHANYLQTQKCAVEYVNFDAFGTLSDLFKHLSESGARQIHYIDVVDDWLKQRLDRASADFNMTLTQHRSPMFLTEDRQLEKHFAKNGGSRMSSFYVDQRRHQDILVEAGSPVGGRWSFDTENRKRLPKKYLVPPYRSAPSNRFVEEAQHYVDSNFAQNPGSVDLFVYPVTYADSRQWLDNFLQDRLADFGSYEDAISQHHDVLLHSVLSPLLNIGLLTPKQVVEAALARRNEVPINSLEGFIRQMIGWREYMRGSYLSKGRQQRTRNFWNHSRPIPPSFWTASTSVGPIDIVIAKLLRCAYAHHIERLMVLSNFMLLCEFHPDQVYSWFMEMFIDSYDWVMVPNVYGMAIYAGGEGITTKPYISGSNYILKMSDMERGPWCEIWDGLYWRFISKNREVFAANHRTTMSVRGLDGMAASKRSGHLETAEQFLQAL